MSYHGCMNVYPKMNPNIGRYLVFHIEFYQLISGMSGCDNSKIVDKRLQLFDAISHDEMAISLRLDSLFSVTDDILVDANGYLQSCLVVCHCNHLSNVIGSPTLVGMCSSNHQSPLPSGIFNSMQCTGGYHMLCILTCGVDVSFYMPKSARHIWVPCNWKPRVSAEWSYLNDTAVLPLLDTMSCHLQEVSVFC